MLRPSAVWEYDGVSAYTNNTDAVRTNTDFNFLSASTKTYYVGFDRRFIGIYADLTTNGSYTSLTYEYMRDQSTWEKLELLDSYAFDKSKYIRWNLPKFWIKWSFTSTNPQTATPPDQLERYWIRITATTVTTTAVIDKIRILPLATYTTPQDVESYMQLKEGYFTHNSVPSDLTVEQMIARAEDRIDYRTRKSWKFNAVTSEPNDAMLTDYNRYGFYPRHRNIIKVYALQIWTGSEWQTQTEGRTNDYFVNFDLGMIYFTRMFLLPAAYGMTGRYFHWGYGEYKNSIKMDYAYGRDPEIAKEFYIVNDVATKIVAKEILNNANYSQLFTSGVDKVPVEVRTRILNDDVEVSLDELTGIVVV